MKKGFNCRQVVCRQTNCSRCSISFHAWIDLSKFWPALWGGASLGCSWSVTKSVSKQKAKSCLEIYFPKFRRFVTDTVNFNLDFHSSNSVGCTQSGWFCAKTKRNVDVWDYLPYLAEFSYLTPKEWTGGRTLTSYPNVLVSIGFHFRLGIGLRCMRALRVGTLSFENITYTALGRTHLFPK